MLSRTLAVVPVTAALSAVALLSNDCELVALTRTSTSDESKNRLSRCGLKATRLEKRPANGWRCVLELHGKWMVAAFVLSVKWRRFSASRRGAGVACISFALVTVNLRRVPATCAVALAADRSPPSSSPSSSLHCDNRRRSWNGIDSDDHVLRWIISGARYARPGGGLSNGEFSWISGSMVLWKRDGLTSSPVKYSNWSKSSMDASMLRSKSSHIIICLRQSPNHQRVCSNKFSILYSCHALFSELDQIAITLWLIFLMILLSFHRHNLSELVLFANIGRVFYLFPVYSKLIYSVLLYRCFCSRCHKELQLIFPPLFFFSSLLFRCHVHCTGWVWECFIYIYILILWLLFLCVPNSYSNVYVHV